MYCQVASREVQNNGARVIVADDTDVFILLLHFQNAGSFSSDPIYMESPQHNRSAIDINLTVQNNQPIVPSLLAAHALTGCDTVASFFGVGKKKVLNVLREGR